MSNSARTPAEGVGLIFWLRVFVAIGVHVSLWPIAIAQVGRLARARWWARAPFLPLPDSKYVEFRLITQYGSAGTPQPADVIDYLRWCRETGR